MTDTLERFAREAPPTVDPSHVIQQWRALPPRYPVEGWRLPLPPWAQRPFDHDGPTAWTEVGRELEHTASTGPFCLYAHIPFCSSKCGFCDSYSFKLGTHKSTHFEGYVDTLCRELDLWASLGSLATRPVSTIHLGGGTPTLLPHRELERLATHIRARFAVTPSTQWAVESTVEGLTPDSRHVLHDLGFRRLHIGVQSMEDPIRSVIGRRNPAAAVRTAIAAARDLGWVVTVDLLCGLPGESIRGFLDALPALAAAGAEGFSLYELLLFPQNRRWAEVNGLRARNRLANFLLFVAAANILENLGFRKNLFNHWAGARDDNRYFTFPSRNEDLLAIGAIADGVFGNYHYRHGRYADYRRDSRDGFPGLEGGLRRTEAEELLRPWTTAILSARIPSRLRSGSGRGLPGFQRLEAVWAESGLAKVGNDGALELTAPGSWFAGNLVAEVGKETEGERKKAASG